MKTINEYINEAKKLMPEQMEDTVKSWIDAWGVDYFGNVLAAAIKGAKKSLEDHSDYEDQKFIDRCQKFIDRIEKELNKEIY